MVALMYAESRLPGVSRLEFLARWRQHGAFALATPRFRSSVLRYAHRDPLVNVSRFPGANTDYDALGEIACADADTLTGLLESAEMIQSIRADGTATFARTRTVSAAVEERHLRDEYVASVAVSAFLASAGNTTKLSERVSDVHRELLSQCGPVAALARRVSVSPSIDPDARWGVFVDLGFDHVDDAAAAYSQWWPTIRDSLQADVRDHIVIVSVRCPLYDPASLRG